MEMSKLIPHSFRNSYIKEREWINQKVYILAFLLPKMPYAKGHKGTFIMHKYEKGAY